MWNECLSSIVLHTSVQKTNNTSTRLYSLVVIYCTHTYILHIFKNSTFSRKKIFVQIYTFYTEYCKRTSFKGGFRSWERIHYPNLQVQPLFKGIRTQRIWSSNPSSWLRLYSLCGVVGATRYVNQVGWCKGSPQKFNRTAKWCLAVLLLHTCSSSTIKMK